MVSPESVVKAYIAAVSVRDASWITDLSVERACGKDLQVLTRRVADRFTRYGDVPVGEVTFEIVDPAAPPDIVKAARINYGPNRPPDLLRLFLVGPMWRVFVGDWQPPEPRPELSTERVSQRSENRDPPAPGTCAWVFES